MSREAVRLLVMQPSRQVAALPVRRDEHGTLQVLLVTTRETRRWVIPKGWPWPGLADHLAAAEEAREEAGVHGISYQPSLGSFVYDKRGKSGLRSINVAVYLLSVTREFDTWPECNERKRAWFTPDAAADAVGEPELQVLLRDIASKVSSSQLLGR